MRLHQCLPLVLLATLPLPAPAAAQGGADTGDTARFLVSRYAARTILQDVQFDASGVPALAADWPTDLKLALALDPSSDSRLGLQVESIRSRLPVLSERLKNELYVESWVRNRLAEMREATQQRSGDTLELRLNDATPAARLRDATAARVRLRASIGDALTGFEAAFRAAVQNMLAKRADLAPALSALTPDSAAILDSRNRLRARLSEAEKRLGR